MIGALLRRSAYPASHERSPLQRLALALWGGNLPLTRDQQRRLAQVMLLPTLAYLLVTLAFCARLTDVVGTLAYHTRLQQLAVHGQWLTAASVGLLVLSCLLRKSMRQAWGFGRTLLWALIICGTSVYLGYHAQRLLVDSLVERASPQQQAQAAFGIPLLNQMLNHDLRLDGQSATAADLRSPEGKLRLAELALRLPAITPLPAVQGLAPQAFFEQLADRQRGGLARNYDNYRAATAKLEDNYRQYRRASLFYYGATSRMAILQRQGQAWTDYQRLLTKRGRNYNPWNLPVSEWQPVRHVLREQMGVPVNDLWQPEDRVGFNKAVARQVRREARNQYAELIQEHIDAGWIEPGLGRPEFLAVAAVQAQWRQALSLPTGITLYAYLTPDAFERMAYQPALQHDARELMKQRVAAPDDLSTLGRDSYRDLITPAMALLLALCGLTVHLFRALTYLVRLVQPLPLGLYVKLLVLYTLLLGSLPWLADKPSVPATALPQLGSDSLALSARLASHAIDWLAPLQNHVQPLGERIRADLLGGYGFGVLERLDD
ncbi:hypothetical protein [Pseudomonas sp. MWU13-3659]|uniref:hypothetical protein n=1 Tax=Pseudomonas sp. MWU13-3659 TaxID=2986964 RepID=UPI002075CD12|nr:hypothetical protein [Pseudomonas sp. MWU13-3659]